MITEKDPAFLVIATRVELAAQEVHVPLYDARRKETQRSMQHEAVPPARKRTMSTEKGTNLQMVLSRVELAARDPHVSLPDDLVEG